MNIVIVVGKTYSQLTMDNLLLMMVLATRALQSNALTWRDGMSFTWVNGRQLATLTKSGTTASYTYDVDGIRTSKTVNGVTTTYYLNGSQILSQKTGNTRMDFLYDENGAPLGLDYNGTRYYYITNLEGDIVKIINKSGTEVVEYTYDGWGVPTSVTGSLASTLGQDNPFRFKGYYYDVESGMYYLQSRYYDPVVGRFINSDSELIGIGKDIRGYNLFSYCFNNPITMCDYSGNMPTFLLVVIDIVLMVVTVVARQVKKAIIKNIQASNTGPDYEAVDELLSKRQKYTTPDYKDKRVTLPVDEQGLLYNKENRLYASEIIKNDLGETNRTVENISAEIFAHQFGADVIAPLQILSPILPDPYDPYYRLSKTDVNENEDRIEIFKKIEEFFEWE